MNGCFQSMSQKSCFATVLLYMEVQLAIAAIAGIILNAVLPGNDYRFGVNPSGDQSRGVYVSNTDDEK